MSCQDALRVQQWWGRHVIDTGDRFPLAVVLLEVIARALILHNLHWSYYVNPGTIFISFAVWGSLAALRMPGKHIIPTDTEFQDGLAGVRTLLWFLAMVGFVVYGAAAVTDIVLLRMQSGNVELETELRSGFAVVSAIYAVISIGLIGVNRQKVAGLFNA